MAATGIGALCAALYLARRPTVEGLDGAIGRSVLCFGAGLLALAASPTMWLTVPALMVVGFGMVSSLAGTNTLLQSLAPDRLRGRVVSLYVTVSLGMTIFGSLLAGTGATYLGAPMTVTIGAVVTLAATIVFYTSLPAIRRHIQQHRLFAPEEITAT
jgi:MFS family permease